MKQKSVLVTQSNYSLRDFKDTTLPDGHGHSPVAVILAIAALIAAIAKLIQVLVPVMVKEQNRQ